MILDNLIASKQLEENLRDRVRESFLCRHRHQNEKKRKEDTGHGSRMHLPFVRSLADIGKKHSDPKTVLSNFSFTNLDVCRFIICQFKLN